MEMYLPEIALKQPKDDPRTVLLPKINYLASSTDHIPEIEEGSHHKMAFKHSSISAPLVTITPCDRLQHLEAVETRTTHSQISSTSSQSAMEAFNSLEAAPSTSATSALATNTSHSTNLVNSYQSCHLHKFSSLNFLNDSINTNVYKFQKTKLLFVLFLISCAILSPYLPTTQAIPVRRTTASGQRLILHSNVYRERYHQNLLQNQRHHQQQQEQHTQKFHQYHQHQKHQKLQQHQTHPQQNQVQRPATYIAPILRKVHHLQHQHHHLHQRAAPTANSASQKKMSECEKHETFGHLYRIVDSSSRYIKSLCKEYLEKRGNETYDEMKETWKLLKLEIRNPSRKEVEFDNKLHQQMHDFYLNLHNFHQLVEFAHQDTVENKTSIEHSEDIKAKDILEFFDSLKKQIHFTMAEAEGVLGKLNIENPNLDENNVEFNRAIDGKLRDFLIIKEFIDEVEAIRDVIYDFCQTSKDGVSNGN